MRVLILGGCGYIGSALTPYLRAHAHEVHTVDLCWYGQVEPPTVQQDYRDLSTEFISGYEAVIQLAGHSSVPMCVNARLAAFENNVEGFVRLLDKLSPQQKFIYASSSGIYGAAGKPDKVWREEDDRDYRPSGLYDLTKYQADQYARLSGLRYYGLRFGTVNGPSRHLRRELMINKMVWDAKETGKIYVSNPEIYRPILATYDLCEAIAAILDPEETFGYFHLGALPAGIYNLASFNARVGDIALAVGEVTGAEVILRPSSPSYNMQMSWQSLEGVLDVSFVSSPASVARRLLNSWEDIQLFSTRTESRP